MQTYKSPVNPGSELKNMDFLAWQVRRAKTRYQDRKITMILSQRPRQRSDAHLN